MKKGIAVLLYVILMAVFFGLDFSGLFNIRQMVFVILGAVFLYFPAVLEQKKFFFDGDLFGQNALWASMIEFFILIFITMSKEKKLEYLTPELAFSCRPVLYGFCIWLIFQGWNLKKKVDQEKTAPEIRLDSDEKEICEERNETENNSVSVEETHEAELTKNITERMMEIGLTKRETEVANLILKNFSNAEIAAELFISETTVKKHVTNIFGKAGIKARGDLKRALEMHEMEEKREKS